MHRQGCVYLRQEKYTRRANIESDDALLEEAMNATGLKTKKATIEEALKRLVKNHRLHRALDNLDGIGWKGDLDEIRRGRPPE